MSFELDLCSHQCDVQGYRGGRNRLGLGCWCETLYIYLCECLSQKGYAITKYGVISAFLGTGLRFLNGPESSLAARGICE